MPLSIYNNSLNVSGTNSAPRGFWDPVDPNELNTIEPAEVCEQYSKAKWQRMCSKNANKMRATLTNVSQIYGNRIHDVRGDGNCGPNAFAAGLLYVIQRSHKKRELILNCVRNCSYNRNEKEHIVDQLMSLANSRDDGFMKNLLADNTFMRSFSSIIRAIGHSNFIEVMNQKIPDMCWELSQEFPGNNGELITSNGFRALSVIFGVQIRFEDLLGLESFDFPEGSGDRHYVADIVILRKETHFLSLVPELNLQISNGLTEVPLSEQIAPLVPNRVAPALEALPQEQVVKTEKFNHLEMHNEETRASFNEPVASKSKCVAAATKVDNLAMSVFTAFVEVLKSIFFAAIFPIQFIASLFEHKM